MSDSVHHRTGGPNERVGDDLVRALPEPPPPRPAQRAAAMAAALERYDGADGSSRTGQSARAPSPPAWWRAGRAQVGALASMALVAVIAVPLALRHPGSSVEPPRTAGVQATVDRMPPASNRAAPPGRAALSRAPGEAVDLPSSTTTPPARAMAPAPAAPAAPVQDMAAPPPPPPPPPPPAPPPAAAPVAAGVLAEAAGAAQRAAPAEDDAGNIVVTGSRISRRAKAGARRGEWNACTVMDPEQSLKDCGGLFRLRGKGTAAAAGAAVAEGLALGWREDWAAAVQALDRAIALQPKLGIAYLNRGLARERLGAAGGAMADLDLAVRYDPSARSYYARSRMRRDRGDVGGARQDEDRAVDLDPDFASVVRE